MAGASGDFSPDAAASDTPETQLDSLFGVSQSVGSAPVLLDRGSRGPGRGTSREDFSPSQSSTLQEVLSGFYGMTPEARSNLQSQLFAGGFYGSSYYSGKGKAPQLGAADDDSYAAFKRAVIQAARSGNTLSEQIDAGIAANQQLAGTDARQLDLVGGKVGGGQNYVIRLADPAQVTSLADNIAQAVLGRKATAAEHAKITGEIQKAQAASQSAVNSANEAQNKAMFDASVSAEQQTAAARNNPSAATGGPPAEIDAFMAAIKQHESGGNYSVKNSIGAAGAYQYMPGTWHGYKGYKSAADAPPEVQDEKARADMTALYAKYHDWRLVAAAWIGGAGLADRAQKDPSVLNRVSDMNQSAAAYVNNVMANFAKISGGAGGSTQIVGVPNTYIPAVTTTVTDVDPQARAEAALRAGNPSEAGAHDLAGQYDTFTKLIKGVQ